MLTRISRSSNVPLSTLKFNARVLRDLKLISFGNSSNFQKVKITDFGSLIVEILEVNK